MSAIQNADGKNQGLLAVIERVGNKIPHPFKMFMQLTAVVLVLSFILGMLKVSAVHPGTGQTITVFNVLSWDGLSAFAYNFIGTWQNFPVLGISFVFSIATGMCDKAGFLTTAIKLGVSRIKGNMVVFLFSLLCVIMTNVSMDVACVLMPILGGAVSAWGRRSSRRGPTSSSRPLPPWPRRPWPPVTPSPCWQRTSSPAPAALCVPSS